MLVEINEVVPSFLDHTEIINFCFSHCLHFFVPQSNGSVSGSGKETKSYDDNGEDSRSSSDLKTGGDNE